MNPSPNRAGLSLLETLVALLIIVLTLAIAVPTVAGGKKSSGVQQSMSNLATIGVAHVLYAFDWNGRQVTFVRDDLGVFGGDPNLYNANAGVHCSGDQFNPACQPPMVAGIGCNGRTWAYWPNLSNNVMFQPINFPGPPNACTTCDGWGNFRILNAKGFHDYLTGRYHDPIFYAPNDTVVLDTLGDCIHTVCEFDEFHQCNPGWTSYAMSAAAMFHPDVMRANADGGFQAPWDLDYGYEAPGLFQAPHPSLKTLMLEHSWLQDRPAECNPAYAWCEPYYFNQGLASTPVTLFYDLSVRLLPNTEVLAADQSVLMGTGGVDGLWHRGTPFGDNGYFIDRGYDGAPLSHHVLTTDGILGRDTLTDPAPAAYALPRGPRKAIAAPQAVPSPGGPMANPYLNLLYQFSPMEVAQ